LQVTDANVIPADTTIVGVYTGILWVFPTVMNMEESAREILVFTEILIERIYLPGANGTEFICVLISVESETGSMTPVSVVSSTDSIVEEG
jgi:hypothetical protein